MAYASRLCNPSPWKVELNWDRGIVIVIEPFGYCDLTSQQMDDFKPGKPGSAEVRQVLDYHGLFLLDTDRTYDHQALEALRRSHRAKKEQFDMALNRMMDRRSAQGINPSPDAFEETLRLMGYTELRNKVNTLKDAIKRFESVVEGQGDADIRPKLDPARTVFVIDPPREFPSVAAMEFFLDKNPDIRKAHEAQKGRRAPRGLSAMSDAQKFLRAEDAIAQASLDEAQAEAVETAEAE